MAHEVDSELGNGGMEGGKYREGGGKCVGWEVGLGAGNDGIRR